MLALACVGDIRFEEVRGKLPLDRLSVTHRDGQVAEVLAVLSESSEVQELVDLGLFEGFSPRMSLEEAERINGPIVGSTADQYWTSATWYYFDKPDGRVGVMLVPTSEDSSVWQTVGRPSDPAVGRAILDQRVLSQLRPFLERERMTDVSIKHVPSRAGEPGVSLVMSAEKVHVMVLIGPKDAFVGSRWPPSTEVP